MGLLGKWVKYNKKNLIYLFISFCGGTHLQVKPINRFLSLMAEMMQTHARMIIFGVFLILLPNFGGRIPPNPKFWDMNRHFQANRAKYLKFHIIETTRRFQPNFAETTK